MRVDCRVKGNFNFVVSGLDSRVLFAQFAFCTSEDGNRYFNLVGDADLVLPYQRDCISNLIFKFKPKAIYNKLLPLFVLSWYTKDLLFIC